MPTYDTTSKYGSRALTGSNVVSDVDTGFKSLRDDLEAIIATAYQGTVAARPTSTGGSPGKTGRFYYATDTGQLFYDYGTGWILVYEAPEAWRVIGAGGQPAFQNSWAAVTGETAPAFYKHLSVVRLTGATIGGASTSVAFTLPAGYRPLNMLAFRAVAVTDLATGAFAGAIDFAHDAGVNIKADGTVLISRTTGTLAVSLDGITFRAEQ